METYRVNEVWQLALVYQVRIAEAKFVHASLQEEFNEIYGKNYNYILIADGEKGIGTLRLNVDHADYAKIERVGVIPECQHQGIGREMIKEAEAWARDKGYEKIVIHSKYSAAGFYDKLGYLKNESVKLELGPDGKPQVYFEKYLNK